jgi:hypothetical protein
LSMNFCDIVAFLLVRCISSLWDDDAEFCHMMHVNCGFLWIWMLDLISMNLVISWLVPGCSPNGCQILAESRMQPASRQQVTVGVAYVFVMGVN